MSAPHTCNCRCHSGAGFKHCCPECEPIAYEVCARCGECRYQHHPAEREGSPGACEAFVERGCAADLAEEVGRMVFAFDANDDRRDAVRKLAARIAAFVYEATTTLEGEQREHRETLALLREAERKREAAESMLDEWKANAPHPSVVEERDAYAARWREVTKACDAAKAKAEQYERDWYSAKSEFGDAMAKMREQNRTLRAAIESAHAELCKAYRDWDADRDSKVGKRIGDIARSLKDAIDSGDAGGR